MNERTEHWDAVYRKKAPSAVSWYRPHLEASLLLIRSAGFGKDAQIIDVGGGASTLVDDLLDQGFQHVAVLDVSSLALEAAKTRLGTRAEHVTWMLGDVTQMMLPGGKYDLWHDRAAFHFLTSADHQQTYMTQLRRALRPGGQAILATFALSGPPKCSGLEVVRYSPDTLHVLLGEGFVLQQAVYETHQTPTGMTQDFIYCHFRLVP